MRTQPTRPNIVIILTDDLGYGDLSCQGHPLIRTPNLDQLAAEGQRWTAFYASSPLCNPSRTALMTGRLPIRIHGGELNKWADLPQSEITIADMLKEIGYATCYAGKWGLCRSFEEGGVQPMMMASTVSSASLAAMMLLCARESSVPTKTSKTLPVTTFQFPFISNGMLSKHQFTNPHSPNVTLKNRSIGLDSKQRKKNHFSCFSVTPCPTYRYSVHQCSKDTVKQVFMAT